MTDVVMIATIVAFFVAAALLVRALDRMIAHSGAEADLDEDPDPAAAARDPEPGRRA
jgi:hypothetical protein